MKKIRIGIIGTSEIAFRRFLPALMQCEDFEYVGVASRDIEKTKLFVESYGGVGFGSYQEMLEDSDIDAVYIPLPPALHFEWGRKALESGKHVFLEKPFTTRLCDTKALIDLASEKGLVLHENYMFQYHSQLQKIREMITAGEIGEVRLYRIAFGFSKRAEHDFRYNKELGGGALLDCGGYTVKLAGILLGETAKVTQASLSVKEGIGVDLYGSAVMENDAGQTAQLAFGMDNCYKCDLEVWGSTGILLTNRIFTAPPDFAPELILQKGNEKSVIKLECDNQFLRSIEAFQKMIIEEKVRAEQYQEIRLQGERQSDCVDKYVGGEFK